MKSARYIGDCLLAIVERHGPTHMVEYSSIVWIGPPLVDEDALSHWHAGQTARQVLVDHSQLRYDVSGVLNSGLVDNLSGRSVK